VSNKSFIELVPVTLQQPQTYIFLFFVVFILVLFAIIYKRNLNISMFGRNLLDVQSKCSDVFNVQTKGDGLLVRKSTVKTSGDEVPTGTKKETKSVKSYKRGGSAHAGCPHVNDFMLLITETTNVVSEMSEIKYRGCMSEQIFRAERHLLRIRNLCQSKYRTLLAKTSKEEEQIAGSNLVTYKFYQALTRIMMQDIKDLIIIVALLNNHLSDYENQTSYDVYIEKQFENIKNVISDTTIEMYMGDWVISQSGVMELHESIYPEMKLIVDDIFNDARHIAIRNKKRIESLESKLKTFVTNIAGING